MEVITKYKDIKRKEKPKFSSKKYIVIALILLLVTPLLYLELNLNSYDKAYSSKLGENIYESMTKKDNRIKAYNRAVSLNGNKSINTCVYFLSEVLRMSGEKISDSVCNTSQILDIMREEGWKKEKDYKKLKPGDVCFTTDSSLNPNGTPSHTYIFMGWKEAGLYEYAYVCDNQAPDYDGNLYHLRNIAKVATKKGNTKDPFSFFMYKK